MLKKVNDVLKNCPAAIMSTFFKLFWFIVLYIDSIIETNGVLAFNYTAIFIFLNISIIHFIT